MTSDEQEVSMGRVILTGISKGSHKFSLEYPMINNKIKCFAICTCGYRVEILHFESWGGSRQVQFELEKHIKEIT